MNRLFALLLLLVAGTVPAAAATIDFEEFNLGYQTPVGTYAAWFASQGYEFNGVNAPGCSQFGCPPEILIGASGSKSLGALNYWGGQDGYGAQVFVSMRKADSGAFAISSLDLVLAGLGGTSISGTLAGGGSAQLSVPVGTGDWLNLELVTFSATGSGFGELGATVVELDNIVVTAVPIPAAVWLFGSALAGLGWFRRKQTA
jgi:hypothetical protein